GEQLGHGGSVEVGVEHAAAGAAEREGAGKVRRHRRFADAALARDDRDNDAHVLQPRDETGLLRLDLAHDVGAAVTDNVAVALHACASACQEARATNTSATTVTSRNTSAPARNVSTPPHGAATAAVSPRRATWATLNARYAMKNARIR